MRFRDIEEKIPFWLLDHFQHLTKWRGIDWGKVGGGSDKMVASDGRLPAASLPVTEVFDSHMTYCTADTHPSDECSHLILLDIDRLAFVMESSTPGHHHLYLNVMVKWKDYKELLTLMGRMGIIEQNYASVSIARGGTSLRAPWIRKGKERDDVVAAVNDYLEKKTA